MSNIKVPEGKGYRYGEVLESHSTDLRHLFAMAIGALATKQGRWYNIRSHHNDANSLSYSLGLTIGELLALLHHAGMAKTVKKARKNDTSATDVLTTTVYLERLPKSGSLYSFQEISKQFNIDIETVDKQGRARDPWLYVANKTMKRRFQTVKQQLNAEPLKQPPNDSILRSFQDKTR